MNNPISVAIPGVAAAALFLYSMAGAASNTPPEGLDAEDWTQIQSQIVNQRDARSGGCRPYGLSSPLYISDELQPWSAEPIPGEFMNVY